MAVSIFEKLFSLNDKVVVLTGAGGVLVGTMARAIAQCGARVALIDISEENVRKVSTEIAQDGNCALALRADVLDRDSLHTSCREIVAEFGKVDCLVNGAGGNKKGATTSEELAFFDIPPEAHKAVFDLNFTGTLLACQVFGKEVAKQRIGSIINIASIAGFRPLTRAAAYAAAKAAVINFTSWLAVHMCRNYSRKIRVNAIAPGFCITDQNRYLLFDEKNNLTRRGKTITESVPQNRFGEACELVSAVVWLLSDSASFVTGSVITIDGGFSAFSGV
jgi:NAD(P)-dependent dehydrogenase (short-subunit alcohol dehydrogenase family)